MAWAVAGAAVIGAGVSLYKSEKSSHDAKKAKAEQDRLTKPFYKIQDEYYQNQNLAEGLAGQGYTTAAKNYLTEESQRGLGTGIDAISATGGSPNDIAKLYGVYQGSLRNTAAGDAQQQIENIRGLMSVNKDLAGQKTTKWSLDTDREYQNRVKELKMRQMIDDQNKWNGISEAVGSIGAAGTAVSNSGLLNGNKPNPNSGGTLFQDTTPVQQTSSLQPIQPALSGSAVPSTAGINNQNNAARPELSNTYLPEDWNQLFQ